MVIRSTDGLSENDIEAQRQHFQTTAPTCLSEFQAKSIDLSSHRFDGHGEELNSYFAIACKCGSAGLTVEAYSMINEDRAGPGNLYSSISGISA